MCTHPAVVQMRRIIVIVNFIFVILIIRNVCSFRRSSQVYQYAQKQLRTIIEGFARNGGGEQKKKTTQLNMKARSPPLIDALMQSVNMKTLSNLIDMKARSPPLIDALMQKSVNMKTLSNLIESGSDINQPDSSGNTPLMIAISLGRLEIVRTLLGLGADVRAVNTKGNSALHYLPCLKGDSLNIVADLIRGGADINQRDNKGYTPLMCAASRGHLETVRTLLELGADIHAVDIAGNSALQAACSQGDFPKVVAKLVSSGADIDQQGGRFTPLMFASQGGFSQSVIKLLDLGAKVDILSRNGRSALDIARSKGHTYIAKKIERAARQNTKNVATTNGIASRSTEPEQEKERDVFLEFYGSTLTLLDSSVRSLSWTQLVLELRSGPTIDAEMEEREQLEDAMMQKAMVAELESDSDSFRNDDQILRPPRASKQDQDEVELDDVVVVEDGDGDTHDAATIDSSAIQNIELSKKTLDWWNGALGPYRDMFHMRMRSLMVGRRSYALCKRLQGSDVPIFESKLYGHRILWSLVKRNAATSILVRNTSSSFVYSLLQYVPVRNYM